MATRLADQLATARAARQQGVVKRVDTVSDLLKAMREQIALALPRQMDVDRFVRVAMTTLRTNPRLLACDPQSLRAALMISAQLGLEPGGPLGHAYLVPYRAEVTFIVGYRGYIDLARRSGLVRSVYAEAVREGDEFEWTLGLHRDIVHRPARERGEVTHVYAVATYRDGMDPDFLVLDRAKVDSFRRRSKAADDGPWVTDYEAMALKTAVRRLATWLPLSVEMARAVAIDERSISASTTLESLDLEPEWSATEAERSEEETSSRPLPSRSSDEDPPDDGGGLQLTAPQRQRLRELNESLPDPLRLAPEERRRLVLEGGFERAEQALLKLHEQVSETDAERFGEAR
jgi:recombination protein RecT